MERRKSRYGNMVQSMTLVILANVLLFILYLIAAGNGIIWLKVFLFILTFVLAILCLLFLYYTGETGKQRSAWMVSAAAVIATCVLISLILNFPSPNPYKNTDPKPEGTSAATTTSDTTPSASENN